VDRHDQVSAAEFQPVKEQGDLKSESCETTAVNESLPSSPYAQSRSIADVLLNSPARSALVKLPSMSKNIDWNTDNFSEVSDDEDYDGYGESLSFTTSRLKQGLSPTRTEKEKVKASATGINLETSKYKGSLDERSLRNSRASWNENCCVFLPGVDPNATDREILYTVREDKVWSYNRRPPTEIYRTCAIEIGLMTREGAEKYIAKSHAFPGIWIQGKRVYAQWSNTKIAPANQYESKQSRWVQLRGPTGRMKGGQFFEGLIQTKVAFHLISRRQWSEVGGTDVREFGFKSTYGVCKFSEDFTPLFGVSQEFRGTRILANCKVFLD